MNDSNELPAAGQENLSAKASPSEDILPRIAAGDSDAVRACLDRYSGLIWSIAKRMSPTREDAEDGVQQAFLQIWKSAKRFNPKIASETTFIAMIARRTLISRLRKIGRRPDEVSLEAAAEPSNSQHERMQASAEASVAIRFLEDLKPNQKKAITLSVLQGMSHQEIADHTGMPLGTVKSHIRRGLQTLRAKLTSLEVEAIGA